MFRHLFVFAIALLGGGLIGSSLPRATEQEPASKAVATPRSGPSPKWAAADFLKVAREHALSISMPGANPLVGVLADWTDEEIRAALEASLTNSDCVLSEGAAGTLPAHLLGAWVGRDFDAALSWFERLQPASAKTRLAPSLGYVWPAEKAEQGLAFLRANRGLFPLQPPWRILTPCLQERAARGPQAVEELLRVMREEKIEPNFGASLELPDGFDFKALIQGEEVRRWMESESGAPLLVLAWVKQDREAAFGWLLANRGVRSLGFVAGDSPESLKWLGGKFEAFDAARREEFLQNFGDSWSGSPWYLQHFAAGISDPAAAEQVRMLGIQSVFLGKAHEAMPLLEALGDPARRVEALSNAEPSELLTQRKSYRRFDDADEAVLRAKLTEWQASPEQIEAIITRFKP